MAIADPVLTPIDSQNPPVNPPSRLATGLALAAALIIFSGWFMNAPAGLLGKADSVGYAICHRITVRSFLVGEIQMPLCARCTGIYLGVVLGIVLMAAKGRWRDGTFPPTRVIVVMVLFITLMGIDGVNSYIGFLPFLPQAYEPQNWLRLVTGTLTGVAVSGLIYPVFNQTLWRSWRDAPVVRGLAELAGFVLAAVILIGLVLSNNPYILYPLALISSAGVLILMTMTNSVIFMLATRTENRATNWRGALVPLLAGFSVSLTLILFIDVMRFAVTQTWSGFVLPG
jgi:uncharacterized membrane protein